MEWVIRDSVELVVIIFLFVKGLKHYMCLTYRIK